MSTYTGCFGYSSCSPKYIFLTFACRKWQNSPHTSRSPWVQTLKDLMRPNVGNCDGRLPDSGLDATTDRLSGSHEDDPESPVTPSSAESDPIPDDFFGVLDVPPHDSSSVAFLAKCEHCFSSGCVLLCSILVWFGLFIHQTNNQGSMDCNQLLK